MIIPDYSPKLKELKQLQLTHRVLICVCGHGLEYHTHGPGLQVSCGKAKCSCVKWRVKK